MVCAARKRRSHTRVEQQNARTTEIRSEREIRQHAAHPVTHSKRISADNRKVTQAADSTHRWSQSTTQQHTACKRTTRRRLGTRTPHGNVGQTRCLRVQGGARHTRQIMKTGGARQIIIKINVFECTSFLQSCTLRYLIFEAGTQLMGGAILSSLGCLWGCARACMRLYLRNVNLFFGPNWEREQESGKNKRVSQIKSR